MTSVAVPDKNQSHWNATRGERRRIMRRWTAQIDCFYSKVRRAAFQRAHDITVDRSDRRARFNSAMKRHAAGLFDAGDDRIDALIQFREHALIVRAHVQAEMKRTRHD